MLLGLGSGPFLLFFTSRDGILQKLQGQLTHPEASIWDVKTHPVWFSPLSSKEIAFKTSVVSVRLTRPLGYPQGSEMALQVPV